MTVSIFQHDSPFLYGTYHVFSDEIKTSLKNAFCSSGATSFERVFKLRIEYYVLRVTEKSQGSLVMGGEQAVH